jgi:hypothetical protein
MADLYDVKTFEAYYDDLYEGKFDREISQHLNSVAQEGYYLERIITIQHPYKELSSFWIMVVTKRGMS